MVNIPISTLNYSTLNNQMNVGIGVDGSGDMWYTWCRLGLIETMNREKKMTKQIKTVTLTRAEGPTELCSIAYSVPNVLIAEIILDQMVSDSIPRGIHKVDWIIETTDGDQYSGTYHLQADRQSLLEQHIGRARWDLEYLNGSDCTELYGQDGVAERKAQKQAWINVLQSWQQ
jgi:hypothetical protein